MYLISDSNITYSDTDNICFISDTNNIRFFLEDEWNFFRQILTFFYNLGPLDGESCYNIIFAFKNRKVICDAEYHTTYCNNMWFHVLDFWNRICNWFWLIIYNYCCNSSKPFENSLFSEIFLKNIYLKIWYI